MSAVEYLDGVEARAAYRPLVDGTDEREASVAIADDEFVRWTRETVSLVEFARAVVALLDAAYEDVRPGGVAAPDSIDAERLREVVEQHLSNPVPL